MKILNFLGASHGGGYYVLHLFLERSLVAGYQDVIGNKNIQTDLHGRSF